MIIDLNLQNEFVFEIEHIGLVQSPTFFKLSLVNTNFRVLSKENLILCCCLSWMQGWLDGCHECLVCFLQAVFKTCRKFLFLMA